MKREELITIGSIVASVIISNIMIAVSVYYAMTYQLDKKLTDIATIEYGTQVTRQALDQKFQTAVWNALSSTQDQINKEKEILDLLNENNMTIHNISVDEFESLDELGRGSLQ